MNIALLLRPLPHYHIEDLVFYAIIAAASVYNVYAICLLLYRWVVRK